MDSKTKNSRMWAGFKSIASTFLFVWLITHHIAQATVVPTESMSPTILVGDHFFLDKVAFPANYPHALQKLLPSRTIKRGEILAFWSPQTPNLRLVKRVIGLPGETIELRNRIVYINGRKLDEPYAVYNDAQTIPQRDDMAAVMIPADSFFMMGDNRDNSFDSRYFGPVERKRIVGRATTVVISLNQESYFRPRTDRFFSKLQ